MFSRVVNSCVVHLCLIGCIAAQSAHAEDAKSAATGPTLSVSKQKALNALFKNDNDRAAAIAFLKKTSAPVAKSAITPVVAATKGDTTQKSTIPSTPKEANPAGFTFIYRDPNPNVKQSDCEGAIFLLRQDWNDIGFGCPDTADKATGASITYTNDRVQRNSVWAIDGTAAVLYSANFPTFQDKSSISYFAIGAYTTVNKLSNSLISKSKTNVDTLAYGGLIEFELATPADVGWRHFYELRGGGVTDNLMNTSAVSLAAEYHPVYFPWYLNRPFEPFSLPFNVNIDPSLLLEYDSITGSGQTLAFNNNKQSLRIGPQISLKIFPLNGSTGLFSRLSGAIAYHWAEETYTRRPLDWLSTSLSYKLDDAGYFKLTASYKHGHDEITGALTNLYKMGLTGAL